MAIARPRQDATAAAPAAAAAAPKPAAAPAPKQAPKPAAEPEVNLQDSGDPAALDNLELHDHSMDVPEDDAPPSAPLAQTQTRAVATRPARVVDEDDDFDDLESEIGFGSYPIMKLDKTEYVCDEHTFDGKSGVDVIIRGGKKKYLYKAKKSEDDDVALLYSYDDPKFGMENARATDGRAISDHIAEWKANGQMDANASPLVSRYYEAAAEVVMAGHALDGELVLLNVAPASVTRFAGYKQRLKIKGYKLPDVVTKLTLGKKLQPKGGSKTFYPWEFKLVGEIQR